MEYFYCLQKTRFFQCFNLILTHHFQSCSPDMGTIIGSNLSDIWLNWTASKTYLGTTQYARILLLSTKLGYISDGTEHLDEIYICYMNRSTNNMLLTTSIFMLRWQSATACLLARKYEAKAFRYCIHKNTDKNISTVWFLYSIVQCKQYHKQHWNDFVSVRWSVMAIKVYMSHLIICNDWARTHSRFGTSKKHCVMKTSSNRNIFHVTGLFVQEFPSHRWIPLTKASDVELWCFLWSAPEQTVE